MKSLHAPPTLTQCACIVLQFNGSVKSRYLVRCLRLRVTTKDCLLEVKIAQSICSTSLANFKTNLRVTTKSKKLSRPFACLLVMA
jgi:hypothetical protein